MFCTQKQQLTKTRQSNWDYLHIFKNRLRLGQCGNLDHVRMQKILSQSFEKFGSG